MNGTTTWPCVIIGGGAAGLSAALVLGRARRRVLVLDAGEQSNLPAHGIGGLLGHDGLAPRELYARGRAELAAYPTITVRDARVTEGGRDGDGFVLTLEDGERVAAERVLLAVGMRYRLPELPGLAALWGGAAFHCPYCHGWEARDGRLAVLGAEAATHRALLLRGWSDDVVLLTDGPAVLDDAERTALSRAGVRVDERPVAALDGVDGALRAVRFEDGGTLERDGIMVAAPLELRDGVAVGLGATLTGRGTVDVDAFGRTTVPGLFAAGDVGAMAPQVAAAIAQGSMAAAMLNDAIVAAEHGREPMAPPREVAVPVTG
ncbi:NAD(P)/FAD-dependent oxidoreductase [Patulibacter sp.]|uniref:NAD(P)/FAD-dependent oxidoreductase n=1 Tax=Patulibacter sp. TaxID=1912859 RepID=UPI00271DD9AC|nr:NAD(P)/FAD-dependent oxidoreductase [Patulibacter sp.]MDO9408729.1 NAD(P)/FAD-dependent oxidoreductase [Patulibacter sp.]